MKNVNGPKGQQLAGLEIHHESENGAWDLNWTVHFFLKGGPISRDTHNKDHPFRPFWEVHLRLVVRVALVPFYNNFAVGHPVPSMRPVIRVY